MSLICLTMAFFLDLNSKDGSAYRAGSVFFVVVDIIFTVIILGYIRD